MSLGSNETGIDMSKGRLCLFENQLTGKTEMPCAKCVGAFQIGGNLTFPIKAHPLETGSECQWWAAQYPDGSSVMFRCFPTDDGELPKTAEARLKYVETEYKNSYRSEISHINRVYKHDRRRGYIWHLAATNSMFSRLLQKGRKVKFRPAYGCEVVAWLQGHKDDFFALRDGAELMAYLESFVPDDVATQEVPDLE